MALEETLSARAQVRWLFSRVIGIVPRHLAKVLPSTMTTGKDVATLLLLLGTSPGAALQVASGGVRAHAVAAVHRVTRQPAMQDAKVIKRDERRRIMTQDKYKRGGAPFDKGIHKEVRARATAPADRARSGSVSKRPARRRRRPRTSYRGRR
jgi:hypothetical protein